MIDHEKDFSLREKKFAKTKIALLNEFILRLKTMKFSDISIKEICDAVEVSEATFYNYFPQKKDVIFYHKALMELRLRWIIKNQLQDKNPLEIITEVYTIISEDIKERNLFNEFVLVMVEEDNKHCTTDISITPVEKYFACPDLKGIEEIEIFNMEDLLGEQLTKAKKQNLIREEVVVEDAVIALFSIMVGVPLCLEKKEYLKFKEYYQTQLKWFWRAVEAEEIKK